MAVATMKRICLVAVLMAALTLFAEGETKMPMLNWAGKAKVVNHHNDVPFRVLERKWSFVGGSRSCATGTAADAQERVPPGNMVIHGDNLAALKSLLPRYEGKIKCIYIDPPYNTGNKDFVYNDSFVDKTDGYRHSKWLSFMEKR